MLLCFVLLLFVVWNHLNAHTSDENEIQNFLSSDLLVSADASDNLYAAYSLKLDELNERDVALSHNVWDTERYPFYYDHGMVYEEIMLHARFPQINTKVLSAVLAEGQPLLPAYELFRILNIQTQFSIDGDSLQGFFISEDETYLIDAVENKIRLNQDTFDIDPKDIIQTQSDIFINKHIFEVVFGIKADFNPRNMSADFTFSRQMPYQTRLEAEQRRDHLSRMNGRLPAADTVIPRAYPMLGMGTIDWDIYNNQVFQGSRLTFARLNVGGQLLGGSFNINLQSHSNRPFNHRDQRYEWMYVNNDADFLKQVRLGKGGFRSMSRINGQILGGSITNRSTHSRNHFTTYRISDYIEPDWAIEVYVDGRLIKYTQTDATGYYEIDVPISYGNTRIVLRFYGPNGELRSEELHINIPYDFVPEGKLEYEATAGMIAHTLQEEITGEAPVYSHFRTSYGLNRHLTLTAGMEYVSYFENHPYMPYARVNSSITPNLIASAGYIHDVSRTLNVNYRMPGGLALNGEISGFAPGQEAFIHNYEQIRSLSASYPLRFLGVTNHFRLQMNQYHHSESKFHSASLSYQTGLGRVRGGINTNIRWREDLTDRMTATATAFLNYRVSNGWQIRQNILMNLNNNDVLNISTNISRTFNKATVFAGYSRHVPSDRNMVEAGFRYNLGFAHTSLSARTSGEEFASTQRASGSVFIDGEDMDFDWNNRRAANTAGIKIIPFLDLHNTGVKDPGDPVVEDVDVLIRRGRIVRDQKDTVIRINELQPYENYFLEIVPAASADISWRIEKSKYQVTTDANGYNTLYVPVNVVGEVTGNISREVDNEERGQGRIKLYFENIETGKIYNEVMSETNGEYYYFGLPHGAYTVYPDPEQLARLGLRSVPEQRTIKLERGHTGDYATNVDFLLKP